MNSSQEEMNMMAKKAKEELEKQKNSSAPTSKFDYSTMINEQNGIITEPVSQPVETNEEQYEINENVYAPAPELKPYDEELFPGGPTISQLNLWKKEWEGYDIYVIEILNKFTFVFRTLGRFEYKQLVSFIDINALQKEETICNATILWPEGYNCSKMAAQKAGIPSTLSTAIMEKSGFTKDYVIQEV